MTRDPGTDRAADKTETSFEPPGSLEPPGWIGRGVRLLVGIWLLFALYSLVRFGWQIFVATRPPSDWTWWAFIALAFWITPPVVNIGFTRDWGRGPQAVIAALAAAAIVVDLSFYGTWWAPPLGALVWLWLVYFSAHLGVSFVLAAGLATPGCEMRAIPHLWTRLTGQPTAEHHCPSFLGRIDRWELERAGGGAGTA